MKKHHTDVMPEHHPHHHLAKERSAHAEHMTDMPAAAHGAHAEVGMGCNEFKGQAMDIAYGQAGEEGCRSDEKKFSAQMKHYDWESPSEY